MDYVKSNGIGLQKDYPYKGVKSAQCYKDAQKVPTGGRRLQFINIGLGSLKGIVDKFAELNEKKQEEQKAKQNTNPAPNTQQGGNGSIMVTLNPYLQILQD